jgi:hypothetical protein
MSEGHPHLPRPFRRLLQNGMLILVVQPQNFQCQPALQLPQGHNRPRFGIIVILFGDVRKSCPGNEVDAMHKGTDQTFYMASYLRAARRTVRQSNSILGSTALESPRVELLAVICFDPVGDTARGPTEGHVPIGNQRSFGRTDWVSTRATERGGGGIER